LKKGGKVIERLLETTVLTPEDIVIEASEIAIEGELALEPYTPPDTITLETVTFEPTKDDETEEIAMEAALKLKEKELSDFVSAFRDKEHEEIIKIKNKNSATEAEKLAMFTTSNFALLDISRDNENLVGNTLPTLKTETDALIPNIFVEFETLYDLVSRLFETYDLYEEFELEVYKAYYMQGLTVRPTVDLDKWKLQLVSFKFDGNTADVWSAENEPFLFENLRKHYQDEYRYGMGKVEKQVTTTMEAIDNALKAREKELAKYVELVTENNIDRKTYFNENKTKLDLLLGDAVTKANELKVDLNNENETRENRINKGEQLYSINVLYQAMKAIKVIFDDWTTKIDDNAADVADWYPILLSSARHPFNEMRLWVTMVENVTKKVSIDITMAGYEQEFQIDDVIYGMQRTELDVFNSSMLLNTIRTKENRDKCFGAQFEVIAGVTCALLAGNGSSYFTLKAAPAPPERLLEGDTPPAEGDTPVEEPSIFHEQEPEKIPLKSDAKKNIVYNCFPQLYSQCKVINTLGDLNMIRHLVPEAALQDKVDICSQKDKISECFLDWSKCEQAFKDEVFDKLFSPFENKLNNLNTDDYETDVDKTKGFLDSQLLLLGVDINADRKQIIADMENHLNQSEPFRFKLFNGTYTITALNAAAFLRNLEDTEKINYFMGEEYLDADLKTPPPAEDAGGDAGRRLLESVHPSKRVSSSERQLQEAPVELYEGSLEGVDGVNGLSETVRVFSNHVPGVNNVGFGSERILNEEVVTPPAYLSLQYELNEEAGLDLRVWARDSGLNFANLESSIVGLPNIPEPATVSINNPNGGGSGDGGSDGGDTGNGTDTGTGGGTDGTNDKSVSRLQTLVMIGFLLWFN
jgi:hypothetical protein